MIDLNFTLFCQWAIFIVIMVFLNQFLFKPVLRVIDARKEKVEGTHESAEAIGARAREHQETYESRILRTKEKLEQESAALREEAVATARTKMDKARSEAMQQVEAMRNRVLAEYEKVQAEMTADIKVLARQISGKILERDV